MIRKAQCGSYRKPNGGAIAHRIRAELCCRSLVIEGCAFFLSRFVELVRERHKVS